MREFNLTSIDWDTVRLMQAGQFKQETYYLEELARWTLQRSRITGLLHLEDTGISRPTPEGGSMYSVTVRGCYAVAELGSVIEIPDEAGDALRGSLEAPGNLVPLYIGVSLVERAREAELYPSIDTGLLQCGGKSRLYTLSADNTDAQTDWLQIAQFVKTPMGLIPDENWLPECMFLSSCAGLWNVQQEIQGLAGQGLKALQEHSNNTVQVYAAACSLAGSLGGAAKMVDARLYPRAYVDRLLGILAAQNAQLRALPNPNLATYQNTLDQLEQTLRYFESEWTMGQAFVLIRECFRRLLRLYPDLLASLQAVAQPMERNVGTYETVVTAPTPQQYPMNPQEQQPQQQPVQPQKPRGIWRGR